MMLMLVVVVALDRFLSIWSCGSVIGGALFHYSDCLIHTANICPRRELCDVSVWWSQPASQEQHHQPVIAKCLGERNNDLCMTPSDATHFVPHCAAPESSIFLSLSSLSLSLSLFHYLLLLCPRVSMAVFSDMNQNMVLNWPQESMASSNDDELNYVQVFQNCFGHKTVSNSSSSTPSCSVSKTLVTSSPNNASTAPISANTVLSTCSSSVSSPPPRRGGGGGGGSTRSTQSGAQHYAQQQQFAHRVFGSSGRHLLQGKLSPVTTTKTIITIISIIIHHNH